MLFTRPGVVSFDRQLARSSAHCPTAWYCLEMLFPRTTSAAILSWLVDGEGSEYLIMEPRLIDPFDGLDRSLPLLLAGESIHTLKFIATAEATQKCYRQLSIVGPGSWDLTFASRPSFVRTQQRSYRNWKTEA